MKLTDVLADLNMDLDDYYLGSKGQVLKTYKDTIDVLAYSRTYYTATILFMRAHKPVSFIFRMMPCRGSLGKNFEEISSGGRKNTYQFSIERMIVKTEKEIEEMLAYIKSVGESTYGTCVIEDYAREKIQEKGRALSKKKFLGEVHILNWNGPTDPTKCGWHSQRNAQAPMPADGSKLPFKLDQSTFSTQVKYHGYFLCKNGNVIIYERHNYTGNRGKDLTGDLYSQGPGTMVNLHSAFTAYEKANTDVVFCNTRGWDTYAYKTTKEFDLSEDQLDRLKTQVVCKELDDVKSTYISKHNYWTPAQ